jgi:hypothetical protein
VARSTRTRGRRPLGDGGLYRTKYLWLYSEENLPERHRDRFASLRGGDLKTARAWAIKESLRHLWPYKRRGWGSRPEKWCIDHRVIRPRSYAVSDAGRAFSVPWSASGNLTGWTLPRASRLM